MNSRIGRALTFLDELAATGTASRLEAEAACPAYCPWSQAEYTRRAASFHWTWASRPAPADIVTAARYGWQGVAAGPNDECTIVCTACRARLVLPWSDELLPEAAQSMAQEYGALVTGQGHANSACPWLAVRPCATDIELAQYAATALEGELFRHRALSFSSVRMNSPPPITASPGSFLAEGNGPVAELVSLVGERVDRGALLLAAMQWQVQQGVMRCRFNCGPGIPLVAPDTVHPLESHAWYCPFIRSGGLEGFLAAWTRDPSKDGRSAGGHPLLSRFTSDQVKEIIKDR